MFTVWDFQKDPKNLLTSHEMLGYINGDVATKFTVQFNLFGGSVMAFHTDRHLDFISNIDSLTNMGCFCFTELGYGNNAPKMETTAIYDESTQTFTINSPSVKAQKYWITNGACHANQALVFAQTIVKGKNEGVNCFIVQIREKDMQPSKGVYIEDMGLKIGLNGIDNGRLTFSNVVVPRTALLNKLNDVTADGKFVSEIKKPSNRFFKVADRLLSGRLCISAMNLSSTKACLYTTLRYMQQRNGAGPSGNSDFPILNFQLNHDAIIPFLARTIVLNLGFNKSKDLFHNPAGRENEIIRRFCSTKALISWNAGDTARACRERCGGQTFLEVNRVSDILYGAHSGATAEGDNSVLMQKIVKDILADIRAEKHVWPKLTKCPKRGLPSQEDVSDLESLVNLVYFREHSEVKKIMKTLQQKVMQEGKPFYDVWMTEIMNDVQTTALAYAERIMLEGAM